MTRAPIGLVLRRGIRGKCPRCGEGALFQRWIVTYDRCSACDLLYQRNYGDIWMFTNIMDRAPILLGVAALFFGFRVYNWWSGVAFLGMMVIPMAATVRHRQGLALALDYLWRVWAKDPSDEIHSGVRSPSAHPGNDVEASGGPVRPAALSEVPLRAERV